MNRPPLLFYVPPGTPAKTCDGCPARVYWIVTPKGKKMPVDCSAGEGCLPPTEERPGRGWSHFATCPKSDHFRMRPTTPGAA